MRLLHIIHGLTTGGAEVDLLRKSIALAQDYGCEITIGCLMRRGELAAAAEDAGIELVGPLMRNRHDLAAGGSLRRLILDQPWDFVHAHLFAANVVVSLTLSTLPRGDRPPFLASEHAMADRWSSMALWLTRRLIQRRAFRVLVPSQAAADSYIKRGLCPESLVVIPNALDTRQFEGLSRAQARHGVAQELRIAPGIPLIGIVARLQPVKGLTELLKAMTQLPGHLVIVGEGPARSRLVQETYQAGLSERVHFLGLRQDVPRLLAAFDVFVLPSYSETFGIAVAEALLAGTPVVATEVGGIPEVTHGGAVAKLIPSRDSDALATALRETLRDLDYAREQAVAGAAFVRDRFSLSRVAQIQYAFYQQFSEESV